MVVKGKENEIFLDKAPKVPTTLQVLELFDPYLKDMGQLVNILISIPKNGTQHSLVEERGLARKW